MSAWFTSYPIACTWSWLVGLKPSGEAESMASLYSDGDSGVQLFADLESLDLDFDEQKNPIMEYGFGSLG